MKAPIENFYEDIVDNDIEVYCCGHRHQNRVCEAQILRSIHIVAYKLDEPAVLCAEAKNCINIFVNPIPPSQTKPGWSAVNIEKATDGTDVMCRNCEGIIGKCIENQIHFNYSQLRELWIGQHDHCVHEYGLESKQNVRLMEARASRRRYWWLTDHYSTPMPLLDTPIHEIELSNLFINIFKL